MFLFLIGRVNYGVECGSRKISDGMLLILSIEVSEYTKANVKDGRIAVALQPGNIVIFREYRYYSVE